MASEVTTMTRKRRKFSKEFKLETVKLVKEGPRSIGEVARDLDLTESAVRNWVRQFDVDAGVREGVVVSSSDWHRSTAPNQSACKSWEISACTSSC